MAEVTQTVLEGEGIVIKNVAKLNIIEFSGEGVTEDNITAECHAISRDWITVHVGDNSFTVDFKELILVINQLRDLTTIDENGTVEERHTAAIARMYLDRRRTLALSGGKRPVNISRAGWYKLLKSREETLQNKITEKLAEQRAEEVDVERRVKNLLDQAKAKGIELPAKGKKIFKKQTKEVSDGKNTGQQAP